MKLTFGKHKGEQLEECEERYILWLAQHEKVLMISNRIFSKAAKILLEKKEEKVYDLVMNRAYEVGEKIVSLSGAEYQVVEPSEYVSPQELDDLEDGFDIFTTAGYHTTCILIAEAPISDEEKAKKAYIAKESARILEEQRIRGPRAHAVDEVDQDLLDFLFAGDDYKAPVWQG